MSSERKLASCRANGAKSHGPITPEGKAICSLNAVKHGLYARFVVLDDEDPVAFDQLLQLLRRECLPLGQLEERLVFQMALAQWRLQRCWACEAALFDNATDKQASARQDRYESVDEPTRQAPSMENLTDESQSFEFFGRRETRLRCIFSRALREFQRLQAARRAGTAPLGQLGQIVSPSASVSGPIPEYRDPAPKKSECTNRPNPNNEHQPV